MANFEKALSFVLAREGGFSDHPDDRGGRTKFGITEAVLKEYYRISEIPVSFQKDIENISLDTAKAIYAKLYWAPLNLDAIVSADPDAPYADAFDKIGVFMFDQGVNRGIGTIVLQAQRVLNRSFNRGLFADGNMGPKTMKAINSLSNMEAIRFLVQMTYESQDAYVRGAVKKPDQLVFLGGWINRTQDLMDMVLS